MTTKKEIITKYQLSKNDTGSIELQIAILTNHINQLVEHLKKHKKDNHTRNGLLALVGRRKRFIRYLKRKKPEQLETLAKKLKLKVK
tara:strand:- start:667 stop:927 length:261 start_codon:yes stop_codon:yes gene_type:complete